MSLTNLTEDQKRKITAILESGEQVLEEIDTLKEGLSDAVKHLAEELNVKPTIINKAIKLSYKNRNTNAIEDAQAEMSDVELILNAAGRLQI